MERLTAFEFIAATDGYQRVRLLRKAVVLVQFSVVGWFGLAFCCMDPAAPFDFLGFEAREDLTIEGQGLGHPYWNGEVPPWTVGFDPDAEARRIAAIRAAVQREINRASLSLM